jgi:hypothetical protein
MDFLNYGHGAGRQGEIGQIAPGYAADFVGWNMEGSLAFAGAGGSLDEVLTHGWTAEALILQTCVLLSLLDCYSLGVHVSCCIFCDSPAGEPLLPCPALHACCVPSEADPVAALVLCAPSVGFVSLSVINGEVVVEGGKMKTIDLPTLLKRANEASRRLTRGVSAEAVGAGGNKA